LAISNDEKTIVSAGADSVATFWEDSSEMEQAEKNDALVKAVQRYVAGHHFTNPWRTIYFTIAHYHSA
jgi:hypothetical protein